MAKFRICYKFVLHSCSTTILVQSFAIHFSWLSKMGINLPPGTLLGAVNMLMSYGNIYKLHFLV